MSRDAGRWPRHVALEREGHPNTGRKAVSGETTLPRQRPGAVSGPDGALPFPLRPALPGKAPRPRKPAPAPLVVVRHALLGGNVLVSSRSHPGTWHVIDAEGRCDCGAFFFRGTCSHVRAEQETRGA